MLYPRNDLAFDQHSTLKSYCGELNHLLSDSTMFGEVKLTIVLDADGWIKKEWEQIPHRHGKKISQWDKKWKNPKKPNVVAASISRYGVEFTLITETSLIVLPISLLQVVNLSVGD